jgi:hypothetical protein
VGSRAGVGPAQDRRIAPSRLSLFATAPCASAALTGAVGVHFKSDYFALDKLPGYRRERGARVSGGDLCRGEPSSGARRKASVDVGTGPAWPGARSEGALR